MTTKDKDKREPVELKFVVEEREPPEPIEFEIVVEEREPPKPIRFLPLDTVQEFAEWLGRNYQPVKTGLEEYRWHSGKPGDAWYTTAEVLELYLKVTGD